MRATSSTNVGRGMSAEVRRGASGKVWTTSSAMRCRKMCATAARMPAASRVSAASSRMTASSRGGGSRTNHAH
jgi:hypothetical protein